MQGAPGVYSLGVKFAPFGARGGPEDATQPCGMAGQAQVLADLREPVIASRAQVESGGVSVGLSRQRRGRLRQPVRQHRQRVAFPVIRTHAGGLVAGYLVSYRSRAADGP